MSHQYTDLYLIQRSAHNSDVHEKQGDTNGYSVLRERSIGNNTLHGIEYRGEILPIEAKQCDISILTIFV